MDENKIFLKTVEEKYERFLDYYTMMSSDFLSLEQQSALAGFLRAHSKENVYLFGGYPEAERRQGLFRGLRRRHRTQTFWNISEKIRMTVRSRCLTFVLLQRRAKS